MSYQNKEDQKEYSKKYYHNNRTRILERNKTRYKESNRECILRSKYGLSLEEYDTMLSEQDGCCAICRADTPGGNGRFHVDHCHSSGFVRGLLCARCNMGLGYFKDNIEVLARAIEYLASYNGEEENNEQELQEAQQERCQEEL